MKIMFGSRLSSSLPNLRFSNYKITSPCTPTYNCIAWAAGSNTKWWWPEKYCFWPKGVPREVTLEAFLVAFGTLGFIECPDGCMEKGYEKIAIFAKNNDGMLAPTHAARQLPDGEWTSKLGNLEDIKHKEIKDVEGPCYGKVVQFMKRKL